MSVERPTRGRGDAFKDVATTCTGKPTVSSNTSPSEKAKASLRCNQGAS